MDIDSVINWVVGIPIAVLAISITLWWLFGHKDKGFCPKCSAPKIFGDKCISCGDTGTNLTRN